MDNNTQQLEQLFEIASQHTQYLDPVSFNIGAQMAIDQANQTIAVLKAKLKSAQDFQRTQEDAYIP